MTITRKLSKLISHLLIGVMLLTQLAVASYACPGVSGGLGAPNPDAVSSVATSSDASVQKSVGPSADRAAFDPDAANLCSEHCRSGQQSASTAPTHVVLAVAPALLYSLPVEPESNSAFVPRQSSAACVAFAAPPPPHAILHCVLRT